MKLLHFLKINYGYFLFALAVFGSALDTSIGLNFLLLFLLVTLATTFFSKSTTQIKLPFSQKVVCLMFAAVYAAFILSEFVTVGFDEEVLSVIVNYSAIGLLGVVVLSCMRHRITFESISPWIGVIAILYAIIALIEVYSEQTNRVGFGYNSIPLGMVSVQLLFWCGCAALKRDKVSAIVLLGLVSAFWVVFLTGSRMPVVVSIYLLAIWVLFTKQAARTRIFVVLGCVLIIPVQGILAPDVSNGIFGRFAALDFGVMTEIASETPSGAVAGEAPNVEAVSEAPSVEVPSGASGMHRAWIWKAGLDLISQKPWFGWGRDMALTDRALAAVQAPDHIRTQPHFHNELINISVRFGVPAAVLLVLSYAGLFWTSLTRHHLLVVFVFLSQLFTLSLSDVIFSHSVTLSMFVFTVTLLLLYTSPSTTERAN